MGVAQNYTGGVTQVWSMFPLTRVPLWYRFLTYADPILGRMNTHVPPILMFTRGTGF